MSRITNIARELCSNLEEQIRVWTRLLELSQAQLEAVKQQHVHEVHAILQDLEMTLLDRSRSDLRRSMLLEQAASEIGVPAAELTREIISEHCDAALSNEMLRLSDQLRALAQQLDAVVTRNNALLEQELELIELLVRSATEDHSARPMYAKSGSNATAPRLRLLDTQV